MLLLGTPLAECLGRWPDRRLVERLGVVVGPLVEDASEESEEDEESLPEAIYRVMMAAGRPLRTTELRTLLEADGIAKERFGRAGAYLYSCVARLHKRGKLKKMGKKYRAVG